MAPNWIIVIHLGISGKAHTTANLAASPFTVYLPRLPPATLLSPLATQARGKSLDHTLVDVCRRGLGL